MRGHRDSGMRRDFLHIFCKDFRLLRHRRPLQFFIEFEEQRAVATFERNALIFNAAEKDAAVRSVERKEVRPAKKIAALFVLFLQRFGILPEETLGLLLGGQPFARYQQETLRLLLLVNGVSVAIPRRGQGLGSRLTQKLLEHFLPAEFPHDVLFELSPVGS